MTLAEKKKKRQYENSYPSVTEILGVLRKIGLEQWFLSNTRAFCNEKSNLGKKIGTEIHEAIQSYIETGSAKFDTEHHVEVTNALKSFVKFRSENPEIILRKSEMALTSEKYGFNGTIDCIGEEMIIDWKTGECKKEESPKIYDEWKYQVSAYVYLYNEVHGKNINRALIVAVAKDAIAFSTYKMDEQEIKECFEEVFLSCLKINNYQKKGKKNVLSNES